MYTGKIDAKAIVNVFSPNDESYGEQPGFLGLNPSGMVNMDGNVKEMTGTPCTYNIHFHPPSIAKPIHANAQMTNVWRENKRMGNSKKMKSYNLIGFRFSSVFCDLIVHKQCASQRSHIFRSHLFLGRKAHKHEGTTYRQRNPH